MSFFFFGSAKLEGRRAEAASNLGHRRFHGFQVRVCLRFVLGSHVVLEFEGPLDSRRAFLHALTGDVCSPHAGMGDACLLFLVRTPRCSARTIYALPLTGTSHATAQISGNAFTDHVIDALALSGSAPGCRRHSPRCRPALDTPGPFRVKKLLLDFQAISLHVGPYFLVFSKLSCPRAIKTFFHMSGGEAALGLAVMALSCMMFRCSSGTRRIAALYPGNCPRRSCEENEATSRPCHGPEYCGMPAALLVHHRKYTATFARPGRALSPNLVLEKQQRWPVIRPQQKSEFLVLLASRFLWVDALAGLLSTDSLFRWFCCCAVSAARSSSSGSRSMTWSACLSRLKARDRHVPRISRNRWTAQSPSSPTAAAKACISLVRAM